MKLNFEVSAKAARLIGRENIADVDGALSELIKNAYDADATCVYVRFHLPFPDIPTKPDEFLLLNTLSEADLKLVLSYYTRDNKNKLVRRNDLSEDDKSQLQNILFAYNHILIADNGTGMSADIIRTSWMHIATSNKEHNIMSSKGRIKTGAKGIGRFALDKLSRQSYMYTCDSVQKTVKWSVDWDQFTNAQLLKEVTADLEECDSSLWKVLYSYADPSDLPLLEKYCWQTGTLLLLTPTREAWNSRLFKKINTNLRSINPLGSVDQFDVVIKNDYSPEYSYKTEEISIDEADYDYRIRVSFDGQDNLSVEIKRNEFFDNPTPMVLHNEGTSAQFSLESFWARNAFQNIPYTKDDICNGTHSFTLNAQEVVKAENHDVVYSIGPFTAELYFIKNGNSDFLFAKNIPIGKRKELLSRFSGVKIYRDNFKVRPYGDEGNYSDWLELDERANRSPAGVSHRSGQWRVRSYQLAGLVKISRECNPYLYDMANREGLTQNETYFAFVRLLQEAIARFEFDRQYIYREYAKWEKQCTDSVQSVTSQIKTDVLQKGVKHISTGSSHTTHTPTRTNQASDSRSYSSFTEEEYRETVNDLILESENELKAKHLLEILSSSGIILNTFFHEFSAFSTHLLSRTSQMRARINYLLGGKAFDGPEYYDPLRKLAEYEHTDRMLGLWLSVVMDALQESHSIKKRISLESEIKSIITIWNELLSEKKIIAEPLFQEQSDYSFEIALSDLYVIINNFILNSVWFLEKSVQEQRQITISCKAAPQGYTLEMMNNGPILDSKYKDQPMRIFEIGESGKKPQGTGIGLWLVKEAVERNNGNVEVLSLSEGFGLRIYLPNNNQ